MFPINTNGAPPASDHAIAIREPNGAKRQWRIPEETPVAFVYNKRNYAVMLATPNDIVDFAVGFSLTERIIDRVDDIVGLDIFHGALGADLRIAINHDLLERFDIRARRRTIAGTSGCGICGLENADDLFVTLPTVTNERVTLTPDAMSRAVGALAARQPLNQRTRSTHAAGWARLDGEIVHVREDVGRHNALDKLLGALAFENVDIKSGFVVMSSRCSYELVEKAARCGVQALVTISGPTNFALKKAKEANMALYAEAKPGVVELIY